MHLIKLISLPWQKLIFMFKLKHKYNTKIGRKMYSINKNKKPSKRYLVIAIAFILILAGYTASAYQLNLWPFQSKDTVNLSPASDDEKSAGENIKSDTVNPSSDSKETPSNDVDPSVTSLSVDFSATTQTDFNYQIRILIGSVLANGKCTITVTKTGSPTYTAEARIQPGPSSSTCQGFDIPLANLNSGTWTASVSVESDNATGTATKEISIK